MASGNIIRLASSQLRNQLRSSSTDKVKQLGKKLRKTRVEIEQNSNHVSANLPQLEKTVDIISRINPLLFEFKTYTDKDNVLLTITFQKNFRSLSAGSSWET